LITVQNLVVTKFCTVIKLNEENFCRVDHIMLTRDLFAVANLLVQDFRAPTASTYRGHCVHIIT